MIKSDPLIERLHQWDELALAEVYDTYAPAIYRYAYRLLGSQSTAQEIVADTYYRLLVALKNRRGPTKNISAWLYRVAHNLVVDYYRGASGQESLPIDSVQLAQPEDGTERIIEKEKLASVRQALWKLSDLQQQVIALRFLEGLSNEEVAEIMGKTVGSVKALQHRALAALRRTLEEENVQI
ncbi:MAG: RNA polymerase sigma factor [Anaerolineales bacterium]